MNTKDFTQLRAVQKWSRAQKSNKQVVELKGKGHNQKTSSNLFLQLDEVEKYPLINDQDISYMG